MSNAGDDKGKRGLFRRVRPSTKPDATPAAGSPGRRAPEPKRSGDMFARRGREDAWSQSAWDDDGWDDDFSDRSRRSSIRPAADPKPEAVDAWLTSDKDDFDDITRDIAVKWSGKEPAATQTLPAGATWDPEDPAETGAPAADASLAASHEATAVVAEELSAPDLLPPPEDLPEVDDDLANDLASQLDENPPEDFSSEEILAEESSIDDLPTEELPTEELATENLVSEELPTEDLTAEFPGPDAEAGEISRPNIEAEAPRAEPEQGLADDDFGTWEPESDEPLESVPTGEAHEDSEPHTAELPFASAEPAADLDTDEAVSAAPSTPTIVVGPDGERDLFLEDLYAELEDVAPPHKVSGYHPPEPHEAEQSADEAVELEAVDAESAAVETNAAEFAAAPETADDDASDAAVIPALSTTTTFTEGDTGPWPVEEIDDDATQLLDIADIPVAPAKPGATFEISDDLPEFAPDFASSTASTPASDSINEFAQPHNQASHDQHHASSEHDEDDDTFPALTSRSSFVDALDDDQHHHDSSAQDSSTQDSQTHDSSHDWDVPEEMAAVDAPVETDHDLVDEPQAQAAPADARPHGSLESPPAPSPRPSTPQLAPAARVASDRYAGEATPRYAPVSPLSTAGAAASTRVLTTAGLGLIAVESVRMLGDVASALSTNTADRLGSLDPLHRVGQAFADLGVTHGAVLTLGVGLLALPQLIQRRLSDKAATKTGLGLGLALISGIIGVVGGIAALRMGVRANDAANVDTNFGTIARYVANVLATTGASLVAMITAFRTLDLSDSED